MPASADPKLSDDALRQRADALSKALRAHGSVLVTAESCTGGWIAKVMTDLAGSSDVFRDGFVTYADDAKVARLGVPAELIARHGVVSDAVVLAMAAGALTRTDSDLAVSVSGIAGPGGARPGKPVGTVWIAWVRADGEALASPFLFEGDREQVRRATVRAALDGALTMLENAS